MQLPNDLFVRLGEAVVAFANLPAITKAADVERLFPWASMSLAADPNAARTYTEERDLLRRTLDTLIKLDADPARQQEGRRTILKPIVMASDPPERHFARGELTLTDEGLALDIPAEGTYGVKTSWLLFIDSALALQHNRRFLQTKRLTRCGFCGAYLFDSRPDDRRTRPLWYCPGTDHKKQKELRERRKERQR